MASVTILHGDCRDILPTLPERSVQTVITSPPYYGLRRYTDDPREIGQEAQPDCLAWAARLPPCGACYVCALRAVFAGVWRVLRDDGCVFLNLGDSYAGKPTGNPGNTYTVSANTIGAAWQRPDKSGFGIPDKNLLGIPWRVALALQADGWILRSDIIWSKGNPMPESVQDRPTRAHEYVFLLAKSKTYYYDADAIAEAATNGERHHGGYDKPGITRPTAQRNGRGDVDNHTATRNRRTVWNVNTAPYPGSHYAVMPEKLVEPCVLAGSAAQACEQCGAAWKRVVEREASMVNLEEGARQQVRSAGARTGGTQRVTLGVTEYVQRHDLGCAPGCACANNTGSAASVVLDPFAGSGTVARVALRYQRRAIGIELNADYIEQHIEQRTNGVQQELFV